MAVRYRWSCQVLYGSYAEFFDIQQRKARIASERGWVPATYWMAVAGHLNDFFLEREYEDLEAFGIELAKRESDYDFMKAMRESYRLAVQGSIRVELFETARAGT
jgi:hypothetical protein